MALDAMRGAKVNTRKAQGLLIVQNKGNLADSIPSKGLTFSGNPYIIKNACKLKIV